MKKAVPVIFTIVLIILLGAAVFGKKLISRYDISYIFIGGQEKEKYGTELNDSVLQSLGSIVFEDDMSGTYIVKVEQD